jgi:O-methyltransferase
MSLFNKTIDSFRKSRLIRKVKPFTMVAKPRLVALYELTGDVLTKEIPGDIVECGVCNGGTAAVLAHVTKESDKKVHLFDSFVGLPEPTEKDGEEADGWEGKCLGSVEKVEEVMRKLDLWGSRVKLYKGWFEETFPTADIPSISLLHIDADWYESVKLCLETFYDKVETGGFVVLDDYGHWEGCRKAFDEFKAERGIDVDLVQVDYTGHYFSKK